MDEKEIIPIILIENDPKGAQDIADKLSRVTQCHYSITHVTRLQDANVAMKNEDYQVILLNPNLPDSNGMEAIVTLHISALITPIVILSDDNDEELSMNALKAGAQDFLLKNEINVNTLHRSIRYAIERNRLTVALNELNRQQLYLATHDNLTGLPNRQLLYDRLRQGIAQSLRHNYLLALLFLDLDGFKNINDSLGHDYGDDLLVATAERLRSCVRESDTIARLGGDEFTIILSQLPSREMAANVASDILEVLASPFMLSDNEVFVSASIGIAIYPEHGRDLKSLLKNADRAMYCAKDKGRNNFRFYSPELNAKNYEKLTLSNALQRAIEKNEFLLHYQAQVDLKYGSLLGFETLLRWNNPKLGLLEPKDFIPLTEETGLIIPISEWVLAEACQQLQIWQQNIPSLQLGVNLSPRQFEDEKFAQKFIEIYESFNLPKNSLDLELTENILMKDSQVVVERLKQFKKTGMSISLDDFGTGYSSLNYLRKFPIDTLKIDQSFIRDVTKNDDDASIVKTIIALANSLNIRVIAEGVESTMQQAFLSRQGCQYVQGYLYSKPMSAQEATKLVNNAPNLLSKKWVS